MRLTSGTQNWLSIWKSMNVIFLIKDEKKKNSQKIDEALNRHKRHFSFTMPILRKRKPLSTLGAALCLLDLQKNMYTTPTDSILLNGKREAGCLLCKIERKKWESCKAPVHNMQKVLANIKRKWRQTIDKLERINISPFLTKWSDYLPI